MDYIEFPTRALEQIEFLIMCALVVLVLVALYIDHKGFR